MLTRRAFRRVPRWPAFAALALSALLIAGFGDSGAPSASGDGHGDHDGHAHDDSYVPVAHTHDDPNETCFICGPAKRDKGRLWCKEHGRYEDRCWLCHPELEDKARAYCNEHFLYEDECFLCHPELKPEQAAEAQPAATGDRPAQAVPAGLFCNEHGVAEIECAICQPDLAAALEPGGSMKVRMPSSASAEKAGIRTGQPRVAEAAPAVRAFCEVQYNLNALAKVTPLAGGVIRQVHGDVGDQVEAGDVLVELHAAEVAEAKSAYLAALVERDIRRRAFEREQRLQDEGIAAEKDFLEAQAAYRAAELALNNHRQKLVNLGFTTDEVNDIERTQDTSAQLVVRAPFAGTLVERDAVVGEAVEVGDALFTVADLSSRWLMLSVPAAHLAQVDPGQVVEASFDELPGVTIRGRITWVDASIDPRSRMVRARAVVTEHAQRIKTGLFGEASILTGNAQPATIVPRDAVQRYEGGSFVFVRAEPDLFALRRVTVGGARGDSVEVLAGLEADDPIVTDGSFIVMSEFLKSRLGAGCTDH